MTEGSAAAAAPELLTLYDRALPDVYGYLIRRCPDRALAEDLTAETFLAAVDAVHRGLDDRLSTSWLMTVARNKLVDHWRRRAREERALAILEEPTATTEWIEPLEPSRALSTLLALAAHHQAALTLRYLDDLPVVRVAEHLGRTEHATEALLVRARAAFRKAYARTAHEEGGPDA